MAKAYAKQQTRVRRSANDTSVNELLKGHRQVLLTLVNYCILSGFGVYIGKSRRDSTTALKVYTEAGAVEDYVCNDDDVYTWAADFAIDVLPKEYHSPLADDLAALKRPDGPGAAKPSGLVRRAIPDASGA